MGNSKSSRVWWGSFALQEGQTGLWTIGPFRLWAKRMVGEWQLAYERVDDPLSEETDLEVSSETEIPEGAKIKRIGFNSTDGIVEVLPRLADRPIIVNAETRFELASHQEATVFVSTPVWIKVQAGNSSDLPRLLWTHS
jgi:hypothetical protein